MKIKYLIIGLCLFCFTASSYAQESPSWRGHNGYKWKEYEKNKYIGRYLKFSYVAGVMFNAKYVCARMANSMKSVFDPEIPSFIYKRKKSSKSKSQVSKEVDWMLDRVISYYEYSGVTMRQYVDGLDKFYKDSKNIQIPIPKAMFAVRKKVIGEPKEEIDKYIIELREEHSIFK